MPGKACYVLLKQEFLNPRGIIKANENILDHRALRVSESFAKLFQNSICFSYFSWKLRAIWIADFLSKWYGFTKLFNNTPRKIGVSVTREIDLNFPGWSSSLFAFISASHLGVF